MPTVDEIVDTIQQMTAEEQAEIDRRFRSTRAERLLDQLSEMVQARMRAEGKENQTLEEFLDEMRALRERVADELYPD